MIKFIAQQNDRKILKGTNVKESDTKLKFIGQ